MKRIYLLPVCLAFALAACTGAETVVRKNWAAADRTLTIVDITPKEEAFVEVGTRMLSALEESITDTIFILDRDKPKFFLKFKIVKFNEGSRFGRWASMGISESSRGDLKVKAALYHENVLLGAWEVSSWVKGGVSGGSEESLYSQAAKEIVSHLRGSNY
jgi:hypothetical protein